MDFLVQRLANTGEFFNGVFDQICGIHLEDGFTFEKVKVGQLLHPHMNYTGIEVLLLAKMGGPETHIQIDLGFGDVVDAIDYPLELTATSKGPIFESKIQVRSYPKEFIFAEKLETVVYRGSGNTRMKDFHDLYSLVSLEGALDPVYVDKVVAMVFNHRQAPLAQLPLYLDAASMEILQPLWQDYQRRVFSSQSQVSLPESLMEVISVINTWLMYNTQLCVQKS